MPELFQMQTCSISNWIPTEVTEFSLDQLDECAPPSSVGLRASNHPDAIDKRLTVRLGSD